MSQPEFESLKATLISRKQLWEDADFPAVPETLAAPERRLYVTWLRPWVSSPACISYVDKIYFLLTPLCWPLHACTSIVHVCVFVSGRELFQQ